MANSDKKRAVFPGSFDPLTLGHVDIITRAIRFFDTVIVGVLDNPEKQSLFSVEERVSMIRKHFQGEGPKVQVESFSGLLVEFAKENDVQIIIRGLRAISDFDYEAQMALMNRSLTEEVETFFLMTSERYSYVSSSLVKQVAPFGGDVSGLVPPVVSASLEQKIGSIS